jgi:hypothetical protein
MNFSSRRVNFVPLPAWVYGRSTPDEKAILGALQYHFPNIEPSIDRIVELSGVSKSSVLRVIQKLESKGWITVARTSKAKGKKMRNQYTLNIFSAPIEDFSSATLAPLENLEVPPWHYQKCQNAEVRGAKTGQVRGATMAPKLNKAKLNQEELNQGTREVTGKKALPLEEPPLGPPMGGAIEFADPWLEEFEPPKPLSQAKPVEKFQAPPQSALPTKSAQVQAANLPIKTEPIAAEAQASPAQPTEQAPKKRAGRFTPSADLIPAALLPVQSELLNFWELKCGERSAVAWKRLLSGSQRIQADPRGGTEILRGQLREGAEAGWKGLSFANWEKFGTKRKPDPTAGTGFSAEDAPWLRGNLKGYDLVAAAEALAEARDRQRALRYQIGEQQASETLLGPSPCVVDAELVA